MLTKGNNMETLINNEVIFPEFKIFKGNKSFVFGLKGLDIENKKIIKNSINSLEATININEDHILSLSAGNKTYNFNLEPYFGFFSPSKFYVGFDFIDENSKVIDNYRRMFTVEK